MEEVKNEITGTLRFLFSPDGEIAYASEIVLAFEWISRSFGVDGEIKGIEVGDAYEVICLS
jgi:hypothetical protein